MRPLKRLEGIAMVGVRRYGFGALVERSETAPAKAEIAETPGARGGVSDPDGSLGFDAGVALDLGVSRRAGLESTRVIFTLPTPFSVRPISSAARLDRSMLLPRT